MTIIFTGLTFVCLTVSAKALELSSENKTTNFKFQLLAMFFFSRMEYANKVLKKILCSSKMLTRLFTSIPLNDPITSQASVRREVISTVTTQVRVTRTVKLLMLCKR